jgi:hypothetical protein
VAVTTPLLIRRRLRLLSRREPSLVRSRILKQLALWQVLREPPPSTPRTQVQEPARALLPRASTRRGRPMGTTLVQALWLTGSCARGTAASSLSALPARAQPRVRALSPRASTPRARSRDLTLTEAVSRTAMCALAAALSLPSMRRARAQAPAKVLSPSTRTRRGRSRDTTLIQTVWLMASCAPGTEPSLLSLLRAGSSHAHTSSRAVHRFQRLTVRESRALSKLQLHGVFPQSLESAMG